MATSLAAAGGPVGIGLAGLSMGIGIVGGLLKAHTLRLQDATNENQAVEKLVPAVDQDITEVALATRQGNLSFSQAATYLQGVYSKSLAYLQAQVGKPGTQWVDGAPCGKTCTVGCCIWFAYLKPRLSRTIQLLQSGKQFSIGSITIPSNKYGFPKTTMTPATFIPNHVEDASVQGIATGVSNSLKQLIGLPTNQEVSAGVVPANNKTWIWILAIVAFTGLYVATES